MFHDGPRGAANHQLIDDFKIHHVSNKTMNYCTDKIKHVLDLGQRNCNWTGLEEDVHDLEADSADEVPQPGEEHNEPSK